VASRESGSSAAETDPAVTRAIQQIPIQKLAEVAENSGIACRMEAMAAIVDTHAGERETSGIASNGAATLQDGDVGQPRRLN